MLEPLESLFDPDRGVAVPLPSELARLYGRLQLPAHEGHRYVISNFVMTLDGVTALGIPGHAGGGEISGSNQHYRMVMGLLRAVADAVVTSRADESALDAKVGDNLVILKILQSLYRIVYGWQDALVDHIDRWITPHDTEVKPSFLTAASVLGLGSQLLVIAIFSIVGRPIWALWVIVTLFNPYVLALFAYRLVWR
jgi:hypothetical protein